MSKTNILTKKLVLVCLLVAMFLSSTVLGFAFISPVKAAIDTSNMSFDNFIVTGGTVTYDTARIQIGGGVGENGTAMGGFNYEEVDTLIVEFTEAGSFTFNKPIDVSKSMISIAPIIYPSTDGSSYDDFQNFEYIINLGNVSNTAGWSGNFVGIKSKFRDDAYYLTAGHSLYGGLYFGYDASGYKNHFNMAGTGFGNGSVSFLRNYGVEGTATYSSSNMIVDGVITANDDAKIIAELGDPTVNTCLTDGSAYYWVGLEGVETYVEIKTTEACAFAITAIGDYDLTDANSDAYKTEVEEELPEPESYDNFNVTTGGNVEYARADILYGGRPGTTKARIPALVVDLPAGGSFAFGKPVSLSTVPTLVMATVDNPSVDGIDHSYFDDKTFTIRFTDVNNPDNYVYISPTFKWSDGYYGPVAGFAGASQEETTADINAYGSMLKGWDVNSAGVISGYHHEWSGSAFGEAFLDKVLIDLSTKGFEGFSGDSVYVSIEATHALSFAITAIGDYDLTDVNSDAYKKVEVLLEPDSYDYFNVVDGTIAYDKVAIQAHQDFDPNTLDGFMGATFNVNTLTVDLDSASSKFTFNKPINIAENTAIAIAPIWDEEITNLLPYQTEFFITLTDAYDATNTVTIRQKLIEGAYYALASHSGMDGVLVGCLYGSYVSTASGEVKFGTYCSFGSLNLLKGYTINADGVVKAGHYSDTLEAYTPDMVIADLADSNYVGDLAWEGFTGDEVYVSVTSSDGGKFAITAIGEYDLTDADSPAYDAMPTAEDICDGLLTMKAGADIRIDEEYSGIRFETIIDADKKDALDALLDAGKIDSYSFGTIIAPLDYLTDIADPTHATLTVDQYYDIVSTYETGTSFKGTLVKIKATNYDRKWIGRGYVKVTIDDVDTYYYADYNAENAKSVYDVAVSAYNNKEEAEYTPEQVEILKGYIDGVVVLDAEYAIVDKGVDYDEPYTVSVEGDVVTITANGVAIKSVVVNGNYVVAEVTADESVATISKS